MRGKEGKKEREKKLNGIKNMRAGGRETKT